MFFHLNYLRSEPRNEMSNNVVNVCASSKASDQPAHTRRLISRFHTRGLIRAFASRLHIL